MSCFDHLPHILASLIYVYKTYEAFQELYVRKCTYSYHAKLYELSEQGSVVSRPFSLTVYKSKMSIKSVYSWNNQTKIL